MDGLHQRALFLIVASVGDTAHDNDVALLGGRDGWFAAAGDLALAAISPRPSDEPVMKTSGYKKRTTALRW